MAIIYANRAQQIIGGAPTDSFLVGQSDLLSIYVTFTNKVSVIPGLNYTPTGIGTVTSLKDINLVFDYAYENGDLFFDFFSLPYDITNIQYLLFSESNEPLCIISNTFFRGDNVSYPDVTTHAKRSVILGGLDINYFGT